MNAELMLIAALAVAAAFWWAARAYVKAGEGKPPARPVLVAGGIAAASVLALYLAIGRPDLPDMPHAERMGALAQRDPAQMTAEELLATLSEQARRNPADPLPHLYTGQLLAEQGRTAQAAGAFEAALRRDPKSSEAMLGLGKVLVQAQQGAITPDALALFAAAAAAAPDDPLPWLYQGLAARQQGRDADALKIWPEMLKRLAPDDPRRAMAETMIREARAKVTQKTAGP